MLCPCCLEEMQLNPKDVAEVETTRQETLSTTKCCRQLVWLKPVQSYRVFQYFGPEKPKPEESCSNDPN